MLHDLFSWLHHEGVFPGLLSYSPAEIEVEYQKTLQEQRKLLSEVRIEKLLPALAQKSSDSGALLKENEKYLHFLAVLKEKSSSPTSNAYEVIFEYIFTLPDELILQQQLIVLFHSFLKVDGEGALAYYAHNQKLASYKEIAFLVKQYQVDCYYEKLACALAEQENPIGIAFIYRKFIDNPEELCAFLLWLIRNNVSVEKILTANILQDFLSYNLVQLGEVDGPIASLYQLLNAYNETIPLSQAAGKIACLERGFQTFSLTGVRCIPETLSSVEVTFLEPQFTFSDKNFDNLYAFFNDDFLLAAFYVNESEKDPVWNSKLQELFNQHISHQKLAKIINFSAEHGPRMLSYLASLLTMSTLSQMIEELEMAIFHLLPYSPALQERIDIGVVEKFLENMDRVFHAEGEVIHQLMSLFSTYEKSNTEIASLVYEKIIDKVLKFPCSLEDPSLVYRLKKYKGKNEIITKKIKELEDSYLRCLSEEVGEVFERNNFYALEDAWSKIVPQLACLSEFSSSPHLCPTDKYELYRSIATALFVRNKTFNLDAFIEAIDIEPQLDAEGVNNYERLLIELFTAIDEPHLRETIIVLLNQKYPHHKQWVGKKYEDESIFQKSARAGNIGCLSWLDEQYKFSSSSISLAALTAAQEKQWSVVHFFCEKSRVKPPQNILDNILLIAAENGEETVVKELSDRKKYHPKQRVIDLSFEKAVINGHIEVVKHLTNLPKSAPSIPMIVKGFNIAVRNNQIAVALYLAGSVPSPQMAGAVERGLFQAVMQNNLALVNQLCSLPINKPSTAAIYRAVEEAILTDEIDILQSLSSLPGAPITQKNVNDGLIAATKSKHLRMLQFFHRFPIAPQSHALDQGLLEAVYLERIDLVHQFFTIKERLPRQKAIENAMQVATKLDNHLIVHYLSSLLPRPRPHCFNESLHIAAQEGHAELVKYFFSVKGVFHPKVIDKALVIAAAAGHLEIVEFLSAHFPSPKSKMMAAKRASTNGFEEVASYLRRPKLSIITEVPVPLASPKSMLTPLPKIANRHRFFLEKSMPIQRTRSCDDFSYRF
ncbi:Ankyrin repeats (3 copies) (plasmid) [Legionella adelaidensis]|uniref:Ankyrin repeats (3 copies) n=2 Tax=Legionella adelaidensis TaxID=45056 RepID=A0A0W0R3F2_9GAMM|nr:Ankyrin repeats (3 copies) [Legionella adelaidensis]VEH85197.1 Ankyrin repeats (3 copies) [Legionella adelaidensis]